MPDDRSTAADTTVALVAAVADNGVIGREGGLPWHYPADLRRFKETTMGHPVVMGRRTYESIVDRLGEPLPGRTNVVLTTRPLDLPAGAVRADSVDAALSAAQGALASTRGAPAGDGPDEPVVYVAGGACVYEQFLPLADRLVLTELREAYEGDAYFPDVDWANWEAVERDEREEFAFVTYERRE